ncbi:DUF3617 domain-containing protein [Aurantiacibacter poecillastricola]|uniref:DUF3617 domain-containing protein n=1 Tax=Aurantiacibacter poecillastricola TaxID=3064385 RepID=UPI002740083E|nr:DUF3617 family protein [Aurantiacibacter sp. 219JJ12-13]MDP5261443.1 DUF3617 family protein [Aurantiacibacter sp. 219JJ12-13]
MRLNHALPLLAGLALAACWGNSDEDLTDEALSADEVSGALGDDGVMPAPGEYSISYDLVSVEMVNGQVQDMAALEAAFAEGAEEQTSFCVTEAMDREAWISAMTDNSCTFSRFSGLETGEIDLAMTCEAEDGPQGRITMIGTSGEASSDMEMSFTQPIPGVGDADIALRVATQRTGDCR